MALNIKHWMPLALKFLVYMDGTLRSRTLLSRGQAILKSGMATPVGISYFSVSFLDTWWVSSGSRGKNGLNLFVLRVLLRWLKPRLEGGMPLLINSPTSAKWVGRFLKRINKFGHGVPVEAPLGENLYRLCKSMMRSFWISVLLEDWTNPLDCAKRQMCQGSAKCQKCSGNGQAVGEPQPCDVYGGIL
jgi:hypothetical protein